MCLMPSYTLHLKQVAVKIVTTSHALHVCTCSWHEFCHTYPPLLQVLLFAEELASVVLTPFILAFSLPNCAGEFAPLQLPQSK